MKVKMHRILSISPLEVVFRRPEIQSLFKWIKSEEETTSKKSRTPRVLSSPSIERTSW